MAALIDGKYEVLAKIKEGGMGAIYKVRHVHLEKVFVVKAMKPQVEDDPDARKRFYREARMATDLKHPNIAGLIDFVEDRDNTFYMVMEYIDGASLAELLGLYGLPPLSTALDVCAQSLDALAYLHGEGIVHRDISPENLMLTQDGKGRLLVKLIDLGVAKRTLSEGMTMTMTGMFVGKLKYGSPEQLGVLQKGERIDGRSDLYSLGCVLYQALIGRAPFQAETAQQYVMQHVMHPPRPFEEVDRGGRVPPELRSIVLKALEKKRENRWQDAESFAEALRAVQVTLPPVPDGEKLEGDRLRRVLKEIREAVPALPPDEPRERGPVPGEEEITSDISKAQAHLADAFEHAATPPSVSVGLPPPADGPTLDLRKTEIVEAPPGTLHKAPPPRAAQAAPAKRFQAPLFALGGVAFLAAVLVAVWAVLRPKPEPPKPAPQPGAVLISASPWGTVGTVLDETTNRPVEHAALTTPARLVLPPGRYRITVKGSGGEAAATVEATSAGETPVHVVLPGFDLEKAVRAYAP